MVSQAPEGLYIGVDVLCPASARPKLSLVWGHQVSGLKILHEQSFQLLHVPWKGRVSDVSQCGAPQVSWSLMTGLLLIPVVKPGTPLGNWTYLHYTVSSLKAFHLCQLLPGDIVWQAHSPRRSWNAKLFLHGEWNRHGPVRCVVPVTAKQLPCTSPGHAWVSWTRITCLGVQVTRKQLEEKDGRYKFDHTSSRNYNLIGAWLNDLPHLPQVLRNGKVGLNMQVEM